MVSFYNIIFFTYHCCVKRERLLFFINSNHTGSTRIYTVHLTY